MQLILSLLIFLYIGALSRSLLPFKFSDSNQTSSSSDFIQQQLDIESPPSEDNNFNEDDDNAPANYVPIMTLNYRGDWTSLRSSTPLNYFSEVSGLAVFTARKEPLSTIDDYIEFWFYDGKYVDGKATRISFTYENSTDFDALNSKFENDNINMHVSLYDNLDQTTTKICQGSYQLSFIDALTQAPFKKSNEDYENPAVNIWIDSFECAISINAKATVKDSNYEADVMDYSIMMTLVCLGHLYACMQMIRSVAEDELIGHTYSLITLTFLTSWDIFQCLFHFYEAIYVELRFFNYLISPAFWYFILASIFETRLLTLIWKIKYYRLFETMTDVRRGFASFYLRLYGFLSFTILLGYLFLPSTWLLYLTSIFFIPQIVHNCMRGQRVKFDSMYILLLGLIRILSPLYIRGCSDSIFNLTPNSGFVVNYTGIVTSQVLILYLQSKIGSRFFIPSRFLPPKYNYFVKVKDIHEKDEACSICMDSLTQEPSAVKTPILKSASKPVQVMQTPCNHMFHEKCLKDWMEIKLDCPYCRSNLPSLE